ncbi:two-component system regulatory protein YycI [Paenactinomyces guangxiensis]|uniref:Two-component system regulatory protein YycI n=1 Tax=Paenactinomyces guangxiensis TaxID=1490290 RepID=A0A7W1WQ87_9BACL|nr:two-component system regulatory protein YycI [Paenactinomyces guangxiensis]MBA4494079.1 two-component system regulatory protein YycI [Paenactinomyces guangxiensis]MBH8591176.1 two-component system regulatory protein YycI [Paenactinomyces guangxiensis]
MDWSRAKTILIIAFILFDLYLAVQLGQMMQQKSHLLQSDKINEQQISHLLKANQIELAAPKPKDIGQTDAFKANITRMPQSEGWEQDEKGGYVKKFSVLPSYKNMNGLEQILNSQIKVFRDFHFSEKDSTTNKIVFLQWHKGKPIFDGRLEVRVLKGKIQSIRIVHFELKEPSSVKLISFSNALYNLIVSGKLEKNSKITAAELGYKARTYAVDNGDSILIPYWRFYAGNKSLDVNAQGLNEDVEATPQQQNEDKGKKSS